MRLDLALREAVAPILQRGRVLLRRVADLWPFTALGMALAVVAFVALFSFGYEKLDLVLLVLGYGGAGLLAISTIAVLLTALVFKVRLRRSPQSWSASVFETGRPSPTGFVLPSLRWVPLVRVHWQWFPPPAAEVEGVPERGRLREEVVLHERGIFETVTRRILVEDAFGLVRVAFREHQDGTIEVLPHLGGIRRLPVLTSLTGGEDYPHPMGLEEGDRLELRRYVPGDPARFIHWKAFGRTRKLMVRTPERSLSRARRTVAYLVTGEHDEAAAAAARAAIEEEALGSDWQFAADGSPEATSDRAEALYKVMLSARFRGESGSGMRRFLAEVDRQGPAALVVFAPPSTGTWIGEIAALAQRRVGRVRVVIAIDAVREGQPGSRWRRWLFSPVIDPGVTRRELDHVGRVLGQLQCEVVIIDRVSGRILGDVSRVTTWTQRAA
ncbi:MAG: DUF58 domain-containing protein [Deltaproteobacteria bacterium]|nr:DUF58 domain-containing protein [Deltaproteobacteria bacterium]